MDRIIVLFATFYAALLSDGQPTFIFDGRTTNGSCEQLMEIILTDLKQMKSALSRLTQTEKVCPAGFTRYPANGACYKVEFQKLAWFDAATRCRSHHKDAHLVVIGSQLKQNNIQYWLTGKKARDSCVIKETEAGTDIPIWTAGQRMDPYSKNVRSPFIFRTLPGEQETQMTYQRWGSSQPQTVHNEKWEACIALELADDYRWHDYPCETKACSVCEIEWQYV